MNRNLLILLFGFLALPLYAKPLIVFDAGSSGTRIYVYDVEAGNANQLHSYKVKPGLSSLDPEDTEIIDQYFYGLLKSAHSVLDAETRANTPLYLYATAGMRMLPADQQTAIFSAAQQSLNTQASLLGYPEASEVRTISGTEEAVFIWLSDNYLLGKLNQNLLTTKNTFVALEMGGASSEIAYLSAHATDHYVPIRNKSGLYSIYAYGYDGLGSDKAIATMSQSNTPNFGSCFPVGAPYGETIGTGDLESCVRAIKHEFIDPSDLWACEQNTPFECSDFGVYQPHEIFTQQYLLTSAFYYLFKTLGLADQTVQYSSFIEKADQFCSMSWEDVQKIDQPNEILIQYCFNAALTKTLFDAWHVNKKDKLIAKSTVGNSTLEWPLGAALMLGQ